MTESFIGLRHLGQVSFMKRSRDIALLSSVGRGTKGRSRSPPRPKSSLNKPCTGTVDPGEFGQTRPAPHKLLKILS
jgi:hypothetical protein